MKIGGNKNVQFYDNELILLLCGPLGRILAGEYFQKYPNNTFLCLGSYFDKYAYDISRGYENENGAPPCCRG